LNDQPGGVGGSGRIPIATLNRNRQSPSIASISKISSFSATSPSRSVPPCQLRQKRDLLGVMSAAIGLLVFSHWVRLKKATDSASRM
jgi:hypothetical protein